MKVKNLIDFRPKFFDTMKNYSRDKFIADVMAGIIVGVVAIPLAIAFGIASGAGPAEGLTTAIIAGLLISIFGGSKVQIGGPTGAFIPIIAAVIANEKLGMQGLLIATIMAGIFLVIMGLCRLGTIIKFMPYPIIIGFTGGIAITIFSTQINDLLGLGIADVPSNFVDKWVCYFENMGSIDYWSAGMGILSIVLIALTPKFSKKVPGSLLAIVVMTLIGYALKEYAGVTSIKTIGDIGEGMPSGLPSFSMPSLPEGQTFFATIQELAPVAFTIAMLGAIESLLSAMVADGVIGDRHNSNTELIGQGIANIATPFFGGIPATGAIARTMANINNGGRTPVAGIVHTLVLLLVLLFLGSIVELIPMPCLAGVLVMVAYNMSGWRTIKSMCKSSMSGTSVLFVTLLLTVFFDLTIAIEVGLVMAVVLFMKRAMGSAHISVIRNEMGVHNDGENDEVLTIPEGAEVFEIEGPFFFGIANKFDELTRNTDAMPIRIVRMRKVTFIDATGLHNLEIFIQASHKEGRTIILSGVHDNVEKALRKGGIVKLVGDENVCGNIHLALQRAQEVSDALAAEK
ncbi:MAG: STAS domain-containing protein [Bacteroidaceae bacterium]|nr:STAS domain-containing protein [Bacteroidaceae bacterium]